MELALGLIAIIAIGTIIWFNRGTKNLDVNADGKVDLADAKAAVTNTVQGVKDAADLNKDGKVDAADVKVATKAVKSTAAGAAGAAKRTVTRAKKAVVAKTNKSATKKSS
jgi:hypothetical protein